MDPDRRAVDLDDAIEAAAVLRVLAQEGILNDLARRPFSIADVRNRTEQPDRFAWALVTYLDHLDVIRPIPGSAMYEVSPRAAATVRRIAKWDGLTTLLRDQQAHVNHDRPEQAARHYPDRLEQMAAIGLADGPLLEAILPRRSDRPLRILEPGGGAGTWSRPLLAGDDRRSCVVMDLPAVVDTARRLPHHNRIVFVACDMFEASWADALPDGRCDVVVLGNVLHLFDHDRNQELIRRSREVLDSSGELIVIDVLRDRSPTFWAARYGLSLGLRTRGGGLWSVAEVNGWSAAAGLAPANEPLEVSSAPPLTALSFTVRPRR
jgi:SAM-dependent methyltransferase